MNLLKVLYSERFLKSYKKLPLYVRKKADKQIKYLFIDFHYPSLRTKKMEGENLWEARIDRSYRFTFQKTDDAITLRTVGPHDEGLGKK